MFDFSDEAARHSASKVRLPKDSSALASTAMNAFFLPETPYAPKSEVRVFPPKASRGRAISGIVKPSRISRIRASLFRRSARSRGTLGPLLAPTQARASSSALRLAFHWLLPPAGAPYFRQ